MSKRASAKAVWMLERFRLMSINLLGGINFICKLEQMPFIHEHDIQNAAKSILLLHFHMDFYLNALYMSV